MKEPSIEPGTDKALEAFVPFLLFSIPSFRLAYTSAPSFPTTDLFLTIARSPSVYPFSLLVSGGLLGE